MSRCASAFPLSREAAVWVSRYSTFTTERDTWHTAHHARRAHRNHRNHRRRAEEHAAGSASRKAPPPRAPRGRSRRRAAPTARPNAKPTTARKRAPTSTHALTPKHAPAPAYATTGTQTDSRICGAVRYSTFKTGRGGQAHPSTQRTLRTHRTHRTRRTPQPTTRGILQVWKGRDQRALRMVTHHREVTKGSPHEHMAHKTNGRTAPVHVPALSLDPPAIDSALISPSPPPPA